MFSSESVGVQALEWPEGEVLKQNPFATPVEPAAAGVPPRERRKV